MGAEFGVGVGVELGLEIEIIAAVVEVEFGAAIASMSEIDAGLSHMVDETANAAAVIVELLAVDRDSSSDIVVDMDHTQDTAGSTVDIVADVGTTVQQTAQQLEQQLENLSLLSD